MATELSKANIVSDEAAEEAAVRAAVNEAVNDKQAVEDRRYTRVMTTLSKLCKQLVDTDTAKTTEAKHHAEHTARLVTGRFDRIVRRAWTTGQIKNKMSKRARRIFLRSCRGFGMAIWG